MSGSTSSTLTPTVSLLLAPALNGCPDLCLDVSGNIAVCSQPYSVAQDVATACQTFTGDCWYNLTLGIPYFQGILGQFPPLSLVQSYLANEAATVNGCLNPSCVITGYSTTTRALTGQIQFTNAFTGLPQNVSINPIIPPD